MFLATYNMKFTNNKNNEQCDVQRQKRKADHHSVAVFLDLFSSKPPLSDNPLFQALWQ